MANKTQELTIPGSSLPSDKQEAQIVLCKMYPEIKYIESIDSYEYRGYQFDYFKAGRSTNGGENAYLLVDKEDERLWLFTYGDLEDRWQKYIKTKMKQL